VALNKVFSIAKTDKSIIDRMVEKLDRQSQKYKGGDDKNSFP
jgi:hypothetical protein